MCNRFRMTANQAELAKRYGIEVPNPPDETYPPPELFPERLGWIVRQGNEGRELATASWGWPLKLAGSAKPKPVTNIRNLSSPMWRNALSRAEQRCLVPVTTFSEYGPGEKGKKPLYWFDVPSRPIFSFAGLWRPAEGGAVFGFLTTEPNSVVAPIHPKAMPVILDDEGEERWLAGELDGLVEPFPSQLMTVAHA